MDQQCTVVGHFNQNIEMICCNKECKRKVLCYKCFVEGHVNHKAMKLVDFFTLIQELKNKNNCNLFQVNANREQSIKHFRQFIESILQMLDQEFLKHQKYLDQQINNLIEFDQSYVNEKFVEIILDLNDSELLSKNYSKLEQFFLQQKMFLEKIQEEFEKFSFEQILNKHIEQQIKSKEQIKFYYEKLNKFHDIPEQYQLIRGASFFREQILCENGIYYGELNEQQKEGLGLLIDDKNQIMYDGVWKANLLLWGRKFFLKKGVLHLIVGQFNDSLNAEGFCIMENQLQDRFEGQFQNGKMSGEGVYTYGNQDKYCGYFKNDFYSGQGYLTFNNNKQYYKGSLLIGKKHGIGELLLSNNNKYLFSKLRYIGQFAFDQMTGQGKIITPQDFMQYMNQKLSFEEGDFVNGLLHGQGRKYFQETEKERLFYEGQLIEGLSHGYGILKFKNGDIYQGQFTKDQFEGYGYLKKDSENYWFKGKFVQSQYVFGYYECPTYGYSGQFLNQQLHGIGVKFNSDKSLIYKGEFKEGRKCGKGIELLNGVYTYKGQFENDMPNGKGKMRFWTGKMHKGYYQDGLFQGLGRLQLENGDVYEGMLVKGLKQGQGKYFYVNGDVFDGECNNDLLQKGELCYQNGNRQKIHQQRRFYGEFLNNIITKGNMTFSNGNKYQGDFENEQFNGQGELTEIVLNQIIEYKGQFLNNLKDGFGQERIIQISQDQQNNSTISQYKGLFKAGKMHGEGEIQIFGKYVYKGQFLDGDLTGNGEIIYENKFNYNGEVLKGLKHGQGFLEFQNYNEWQSYRGSFENDEITGFGCLKYVNGDTFQGNFVCGLREGEGCMLQFNVIPKQTLQYKGGYRNDKRSGKGVLSQNGMQDLQLIRTIYDGMWQEDKYHGEGVLLSPEGSYRGDFVEGLKQGKGLEFNKSGKKIFEGEFQANQRHGKGISYYQNQKIEFEGDFLNGQRHGYGCLKYENGDLYQGQFQHNKFHGYGRKIFNKNKSSFQGKFINSQYYFGYLKCQEYEYCGYFKDKQAHNKGVQFNTDKTIIYKGQFYEGKHQGKGVQVIIGKEVYKGEFQNNSQNGFGETRFSDQSLYTGYYKDGFFEGYGKLEYPNGDIYKGNFIKGLRQNEGHLYFSNGDDFEGTFERDNLKNGKLKYKNGDIFEGQFQKNQIFKGKMTYINGNCYEGDFQYNLYYGKGKLIEKIGNQIIEYSGDFRINHKEGFGVQHIYKILEDEEKQLVTYYKGKFQNGLMNDDEGELIKDQINYKGSFVNEEQTGDAVIVYANQDKYKGKVLQGKKVGKGTLEFSRNNNDGRKQYHGEFKNDEITGFGKLIYVNGDVYDGEFIQGKKHGEGCFEKTNGLKYVGQFKDDLKSGQGVEYQMERIIYNGIWENDNYNVKGILFNPTGGYYEGNFLNGQQFGEGKEYDNIGRKKFEGNFIGGQKQGFGRTYIYLDNGNQFLEYEGEFFYGKMNGQGIFNYPSSVNSKLLKYEGKFIDDKKDGAGKETSVNGEVYEGGFSNNLRTGDGIITYPDGKVFHGKFKDGKRNGEGRMIFSNGEKEIGQYSNDLQQGIHRYFMQNQMEHVRETTYQDGRITGQRQCEIF